MSKKRDKTNAMQASTAISRQKSGTPGSDKPGGELLEKPTKADDGLARVHQAFATTDIDLIVYLRLQAASTASGDSY